MATPRFIKCLTDVSQKLGMMKDVPKIEKTNILKKELNRINAHLPASVYIPFVQNSTRNYCVLHIPPDEVRVFQTKERAPILLSIEVFRPDEMAIVLKQNMNKKALKSLGKQGDRDERIRYNTMDPRSDNPYLAASIEEDSKEHLLEDQNGSQTPTKKIDLKKMFGRRERRTTKKEKKEISIKHELYKRADANASKPMNIDRFKKQNKNITQLSRDTALSYHIREEKPFTFYQSAEALERKSSG